MNLGIQRISGITFIKYTQSKIELHFKVKYSIEHLNSSVFFYCVRITKLLVFCVVSCVSLLDFFVCFLFAIALFVHLFTVFGC
jgi:hypothetical protein